MLSIGVIRSSLKENERRVPVYPEHLLWIPAEIRNAMWFEAGYGADYRYPDEYFGKNAAGIVPRDELFSRCDVLILPKPVEEDLRQMRPHQVLWGWAHSVQQIAITQAAIDRRLTLIAWEAMHGWTSQGERTAHCFSKNNELAGYAAIHHTLALKGADGLYGPRRYVAVLGFGSVSRGAIHALHGRGFNNIHVHTRRPVHLVANQIPDVYHYHLEVPATGGPVVREQSGETRPLIEELAKADIICNGVLQDPDDPMMFVRNEELSRLRPRSTIVDISCDKGMGFEFAEPTTFDDPAFFVGEGILYYSVDHVPSYLWDAASREISRAMIPYLPIVAAGAAAWDADETIRRAIEIRDGQVQNPKILSFQKRGHEYPHAIA